MGILLSTHSALSMFPDAPHEPPYPKAKEILAVERVDDRQFLVMLFTAMWSKLPEPKKKTCCDICGGGDLRGKNIDLMAVADGTYTGEYDAGMEDTNR